MLLIIILLTITIYLYYTIAISLTKELSKFTQTKCTIFKYGVFGWIENSTLVQQKYFQNEEIKKAQNSQTLVF